MIQNETVMTVADNSGARKAMCIKVLGGSHRRYATVGDKIVVAIKEAIPRGKVQYTARNSHKYSERQNCRRRSGTPFPPPAVWQVRKAEQKV